MPLGSRDSRPYVTDAWSGAWRRSGARGSAKSCSVGLVWGSGGSEIYVLGAHLNYPTFILVFLLLFSLLSSSSPSSLLLSMEFLG